MGNAQSSQNNNGGVNSGSSGDGYLVDLNKMLSILKKKESRIRELEQVRLSLNQTVDSVYRLKDSHVSQYKNKARCES